MYIIIVGGGEVGYELAHHLIYQGQNVVVIENDKGRVERFKKNPALKVVEGNGAQALVLEQAGIKKADLLVAVTDMDEVNTLACLLAKKYYVPHTVCRIRGKGFLKEDSSLISQFGIDMVINPEKVAALEILRMLQFSDAGVNKSFAGDRIRHVVIFGGGALGYQLALLLESSRQHFVVKLIEKSMKVCKKLDLELQKTLVLNGDVTEISMLKEEELYAADAVIAATSDDRTNIVAALLVREFGPKKIICEVKKQQNIPVYKTLGLDSLISPRLLVAAQINCLTRGEELLDLSILPGEMDRSI
jgi:Trk K+ transport system NAD-binding subunit